MIGIDYYQTIAKECPKYPEPSSFDTYKHNRVTALTTFQADAEEAISWLVMDTLKAASRYIGWLEANITAANREMYGIHAASSDDEKIDYCPKDITSLLEVRKILGEAFDIVIKNSEQKQSK